MDTVTSTLKDLSLESNIDIHGVATTISLVPFSDVDFLIISQTQNFASLIMIENQQSRSLLGSRDVLYDIYAQHILQEFNPSKPLLLSIGLIKHELDLFENDVVLEEYKKTMLMIMNHIRGYFNK